MSAATIGTTNLALPEALPIRRGVVRDTWTVMVRELRPVLRNPFSVVFGLVQPLIFLALFGPLLSGSLGAQSEGVLGGGVWQWFVPSIIAMTTLFGTSTTGANLLFEFQTGAHERMLVTPLSRSSLLVGRALKEIVPLLAQAAVVVAVMMPFGFELHLTGALAGLALLAVFGVGLGALSYALAIAVRKADWMFWMVQQTFLFPLLILSGTLLPLETGPQWMRTVAEFNPLAHVLDAERALFAGDLTGSVVWQGLAAAVATSLVGLLIGVRAMRRSAG